MVQLGVGHGGGREVSPLPYYRVEDACKTGTFHLQELLPRVLALAVQTQTLQAARLGLVEQDVHTETPTETPRAARQHRNKVQPSSVQAPSYKPHPEESCRAIGKEETFREGKMERRSKLASTKGQRDCLPLHSHIMSINPVQSLDPLLHPCSPSSKDWFLPPGPLKTRAD